MKLRGFPQSFSRIESGQRKLAGFFYYPALRVSRVASSIESHGASRKPYDAADFAAITALNALPRMLALRRFDALRWSCIGSADDRKYLAELV